MCKKDKELSEKNVISFLKGGKVENSLRKSSLLSMTSDKSKLSSKLINKFEMIQMIQLAKNPNKTAFSSQRKQCL